MCGFDKRNKTKSTVHRLDTDDYVNNSEKEERAASCMCKHKLMISVKNAGLGCMLTLIFLRVTACMFDTQKVHESPLCAELRRKQTI